MLTDDKPESIIDEPTTESLSIRLSRNISAHRRALDLTQSQLAKQLGIEKETLSRFERGKHVPSLATLERLAGILQTTVAELLAEKPPVPDDDAIIITSWLSSLSVEGKTFIKEMIKQFCEYLETQGQRE